MARPSRPWFRFYVEALSDRKLRRLTPAQRWLWVAVLGAARQSCIPGLLLVSEREPMDAADLADIAAMTVKEVAAALPRFEAAGMIHLDDGLGCWAVTAWHERQFESDDVTARTTKHRSKERSNDVPGTPSESETDTDTESSSSSSSVPDELWKTLARKKLAISKDVKNVPRWLDKVIANDRAELGARAQELWDRYEISVSHLADVLAAGGSSPSLNQLRLKETA